MTEYLREAVKQIMLTCVEMSATSTDVFKRIHGRFLNLNTVQKKIYRIFFSLFGLSLKLKIFADCDGLHQLIVVSTVVLRDY